jgi:hypothetical protein
MAANTLPIFALTPNVSWAQGALTANTTTDLTSGTIYTVFTAGTNGSWLTDIRIKALGSNVASLIRFWINNGSSTGSAANNSFFDEFPTVATTASNLQPQPYFILQVQRAIPANYVIYATLPTGVAAGFDITAFGGNY